MQEELVAVENDVLPPNFESHRSASIDADELLFAENTGDASML